MSYTAACEELRDDIARKLEKIADHAEDLRDDETTNRQLILEDMIDRVNDLVAELDRIPRLNAAGSRRYNYPMEGEE